MGQFVDRRLKEPFALRKHDDRQSIVVENRQAKLPLAVRIGFQFDPIEIDNASPQKITNLICERGGFASEQPHMASCMTC